MDEKVETALRFVAAQLAVATAGIHLWLGWRALYAYINAGRPFTDPRMVLFVLSAIAVPVGIGLAAAGMRRDYVYSLGIGLMACYLVGWLLFGGHPQPGQLTIAPAWTATGEHTHGSILSTLVEHLFSQWELLASKVIESILLVVLVVLLCEERRDSAGSEGDATDAEATA
ncbi:hypothetical protein [Haloarchaeobius sp. HME9146]|uniref:hypothetical protein n=1 Tax=Haloarchaeobius sp. HME9146 TaxID=2978732 RepID=UPI0021BE3B72|nr:hypothetical protein [Haloarchaeobius sp. HME9146]MCT9094711.1 hypothetical protein [Haloarchaeobius sp. HME9146]